MIRIAAARWDTKWRRYDAPKNNQPDPWPPLSALRLQVDQSDETAQGVSTLQELPLGQNPVETGEAEGRKSMSKHPYSEQCDCDRCHRESMRRIQQSINAEQQRRNRHNSKRSDMLLNQARRAYEGEYDIHGDISDEA